FKNNSKDNAHKILRKIEDEGTQRNLKITSEVQVRGGLVGIIVNRLKSGSYRVKSGRRRTDNEEKDEKQSQNDKTGLGMEKPVKDKAKSKLVKVKVNPSQPRGQSQRNIS
ncbi:hypothetical protein Tco_0292987, partial [Tanacetum coccineum]